MLSELRIEKYRGIHNLELKDLGMINIIAGANNTGKTSILEVIESLKAPNNLMNWRKIANREGNNGRITTSFYDTIKSIFSLNLEDEDMYIAYGGTNNNQPFEVELKGRKYDSIISGQLIKRVNQYLRLLKEGDRETEIDSEYPTEVIEVKILLNGNVVGEDTIYEITIGERVSIERDEKAIINNVLYISPTQHAQNIFFLDSLLTDPELYEQFVMIMREFDPGFISVNAVTSERGNGRKYIVLSKNHKEGLLLNAYGDGMKKAMLLLSSVLKVKNGILLLDEFETAIHTSAMENVFGWILKMAKKLNVQIFMTSHSIEAIETVLKCCPELQEDIRMITLVKVDDAIKVRNVDGKKAIQMMDEYGLELR